MPIYEYQCDCGAEREIILSFGDGSTQVCSCGETMQRKLSLPAPAIIRQTGKGMALNTLNSKRDGMPNKWWKSGAENYAFSGVEPLARRVYQGFG